MIWELHFKVQTSFEAQNSVLLLSFSFPSSSPPSRSYPWLPMIVCFFLTHLLLEVASPLSLSLSSLSLSTDTHASFSLSKTPGQISIALRWFEWFLSVFLRCFASLLLQLSANVRCVWFLRFEVIDLIASTAKLGSLSFMGTTHLLFFICGEIKVGFLVLGFCFFTTLWFFPFMTCVQIFND